ncbi:hypothetical protein [Halobellus inordinatus]|uniref:hypothetical protein n=1 Tax=Halobellus inordinatus TaxID=1126236 RepID=UPI00210AF9F9|nr:hypothetical protein [Halobellus inordinatus]
MIEGIAGRAITALGLKGVSTVALVLLVSVLLYTHKAATAGQRVVHAGSTIQHDLKVIALVLTVLLVLGVATIDIERGRELIQVGLDHVRRTDLVAQLGRWIS